MQSESINNIVVSTRQDMISFLQKIIRIPSVSGNEKELTEFIRRWSEANGFQTDIFEIDPTDSYKHYLTLPKHIPFPGRPALVVKLPGNANKKNLIFNAHTDTVSIGNKSHWNRDPFSGEYSDGKIYGRGACDTKGALVSALWAMTVIKNTVPPGDRGDILLELIPGEEDCVGLGTLGCIKRGYKADSSIILEPTESLPRCASRGGLRFHITTHGKAIHGTVKWLGTDSIKSIRKILDTLDELENRWNDRAGDPLFNSFPIARPVTVDKVAGGEWQGMVCDKCICEGYFELLPDDDINRWQSKFSSELKAMLPDENIEVSFSENYSGHKTSTDSVLCHSAEEAVKKLIAGNRLTWNGWSAFNSGCESGIRSGLHGTPTLVWGPGSVTEAHSPNEFVIFKDVEICAELFIDTLTGLFASDKNS